MVLEQITTTRWRQAQTVANIKKFLFVFCVFFLFVSLYRQTQENPASSAGSSWSFHPPSVNAKPHLNCLKIVDLPCSSYYGGVSLHKSANNTQNSKSKVYYIIYMPYLVRYIVQVNCKSSGVYKIGKVSRGPVGLGQWFLKNVLQKH